jgi:hypothetical protein
MSDAVPGLGKKFNPWSGCRFLGKNLDEVKKIIEEHLNLQK